VMATPTKPNSRLGTYVVKTFKDESLQFYKCFIWRRLWDKEGYFPSLSCTYLYLV